MNKNALIVAVIFLAASLIVPGFVLYEEATSSLTEYIQQIPNLSGHDTATQQFIANQQQRQAEVFAIVLVIEAVLVACFAVSMWYAIKCNKADQCRAFPPP